MIFVLYTLIIIIIFFKLNYSALLRWSLPCHYTNMSSIIIISTIIFNNNNNNNNDKLIYIYSFIIIINIDCGIYYKRFC